LPRFTHFEIARMLVRLDHVTGLIVVQAQAGALLDNNLRDV
jgi:hypothetical protein